MSRVSPVYPLHNSPHCICPVWSSGGDQPLAWLGLGAASSRLTWDRKGLETGSSRGFLQLLSCCLRAWAA